MEHPEEIIKRIQEEHTAFGNHMGYLCQSVADEEALATLEKALMTWAPGQAGVLREKQERLEWVLTCLRNGLSMHFVYEEDSLADMLGKPLMRGVRLQHQDILKEIDETISMVGSLKQTDRNKLLAEESRIAQRINFVRQLLEEHSSRESAILLLVQRGLANQE